jgi:DNA-binding MarR family transcriptional regulator
MGQPQESLTYLLQKAAKQSLVALEAALDGLDLTSRQFLLLALVEGHQDLSQQHLAAKLSVDPTVVVKLVDQLEARDLLTRARAADDRRQHRLALTEAGQALLQEASARQGRAEREFTRAIGNRRRELVALLGETLGYATKR